MSDDVLAQYEDSDAGVKWRVRRFAEKAPNDAPWPIHSTEPWWDHIVEAVRAPRRLRR